MQSHGLARMLGARTMQDTEQERGAIPIERRECNVGKMWDEVIV